MAEYVQNGQRTYRCHQFPFFWCPAVTCCQFLARLTSACYQVHSASLQTAWSCSTTWTQPVTAHYQGLNMRDKVLRKESATDKRRWNTTFPTSLEEGFHFPDLLLTQCSVDYVYSYRLLLSFAYVQWSQYSQPIITLKNRWKQSKHTWLLYDGLGCAFHSRVWLWICKS